MAPFRPHYFSIPAFKSVTTYTYPWTCISRPQLPEVLVRAILCRELTLLLGLSYWTLLLCSLPCGGFYSTHPFSLPWGPLFIMGSMHFYSYVWSSPKTPQGRDRWSNHRAATYNSSLAFLAVPCVCFLTPTYGVLFLVPFQCNQSYKGYSTALFQPNVQNKLWQRLCDITRFFKFKFLILNCTPRAELALLSQNSLESLPNVHCFLRPGWPGTQAADTASFQTLLDFSTTFWDTHSQRLHKPLLTSPTLLLTLGGLLTCLMLLEYFSDSWETPLSDQSPGISWFLSGCFFSISWARWLLGIICF